jgi:excisionase family DNA binding protein
MTAVEAQWLRPHEAAAVLGVTTQTLAEWADNGKIPAADVDRTEGDHRRYRASRIRSLRAERAS